LQAAVRSPTALCALAVSVCCCYQLCHRSCSNSSLSSPPCHRLVSASNCGESALLTICFMLSFPFSSQHVLSSPSSSKGFAPYLISRLDSAQTCLLQPHRQISPPLAPLRLNVLSGSPPALAVEGVL
jgi:hypothetical protein